MPLTVITTEEVVVTIDGEGDDDKKGDDDDKKDDEDKKGDDEDKKDDEPVALAPVTITIPAVAPAAAEPEKTELAEPAKAEAAPEPEPTEAEPVKEAASPPVKGTICSLSLLGYIGKKG